MLHQAKNCIFSFAGGVVAGDHGVGRGFQSVIREADRHHELIALPIAHEDQLRSIQVDVLPFLGFDPVSHHFLPRTPVYGAIPHAMPWTAAA